MSIKELNRDDLLNRFASHTFTETVVGSSTLVEFKDAGSVVIGSSTSSVVDNAYAKIRSVLVGDSSILPRLTTSQRDALTSTVDGTQILNIDNESIEKFENSTFESTNQVLGGNFNFQGLTKIGGDTSVAPAGAMDIIGDNAANTRIRTTRYQDNANGGAGIQLGHSRGEEGSPSALQSGDKLGQLLFTGDDGTSENSSGAFVRAYTTEDWDPTSKGNQIRLETIPNGGVNGDLQIGLIVTEHGYPQVPEYTVSTVPNVGVGGGIIAVTDETGGYTLAFSDGTNWRRVQDRAIVA